MLRTKIQSALCNGTPGLLPITIWKFFNNHISGMLLHIYCQLLRGIFCCCTCRISLLFTKNLLYLLCIVLWFIFQGLFFSKILVKYHCMYVLVTVTNQCAINMSKWIIVPGTHVIVIEERERKNQIDTRFLFQKSNNECILRIWTLNYCSKFLVNTAKKQLFCQISKNWHLRISFNVSINKEPFPLLRLPNICTSLQMGTYQIYIVNKSYVIMSYRGTAKIDPSKPLLPILMIQLGAFTIYPMQLLHRVTRKNVYFFQKRQVKLSNDTALDFLSSSSYSIEMA